ncbi:MAG: hypothetical protein Q9218_004264 [Villophora microphyllina]
MIIRKLNTGYTGGEPEAEIFSYKDLKPDIDEMRDHSKREALQKASRNALEETQSLDRSLFGDWIGQLKQVYPLHWMLLSVIIKLEMGLKLDKVFELVFKLFDYIREPLSQLDGKRAGNHSQEVFLVASEDFVSRLDRYLAMLNGAFDKG